MEPFLEKTWIQNFIKAQCVGQESRGLCESVDLRHDNCWWKLVMENHIKAQIIVRKNDEPTGTGNNFYT